MKKTVFFLLILLLSACGAEQTVNTLQSPSPDQAIPSSREGLELSLAQEAFTESPSFIDTIVTNDSQQAYEYGDYNYIEVKKNGEWYTLIHSDAVFLKNPQLKDYGHVLPAGGKLQQQFSIDLLGITLFPGDYRLVKTFSHAEPYHEVSLAVLFSVE